MMEDLSPQRIVRWPTDDERQKAFQEYTVAVGEVVHAWNYLHEKLGELFVAVLGADAAVTLAVWYSSDNDRAQRGMLRAAIEATPRDRWKSATAIESLQWLMNEADKISDDRNNAVHAPCSLYVGTADDGGTRMGAAFFNGHRRAKKLQGKEILSVFKWCERSAETLSEFAQQLASAIFSNENYPWPDRPKMPAKVHTK